MLDKRVFVTVGTTKFDKLINTISKQETLNTLYNLGYKFVQLQTGTQFSKPEIDPNIEFFHEITEEKDSICVNFASKITLRYNSYFANFAKEIESSDLIISHAGAGTCLEVLRQAKPLIVVVNQDLMDNHQSELAEQLQKDGYLYYCTCDTLNETLKKDFSKLKPYPIPQENVFSRYLDMCMGFV